MTTAPLNDDEKLATKVLALRRAGATIETISARLSISVEQADELLTAVLDAYDPRISAKLEADRLDRLHLGIWERAQRGDIDAIDRVLRIADARRKVLADPSANTHELRAAYDEAVKSSPHVADIDRALVATGAKIADRVDEAVATGEGQEVTKALYLLPHMVNVLRELLATPQARHNAGLDITEQHGSGKLAQLRSLRGVGVDSSA